MDMVGVFGRRIALAEVRSPANSWHPDLAEPDHVQHTECLRVGHAPGRESCAVRLVGTRGDATETALGGREVAGSALGVFTVVLGPPAMRVSGEAGQARLGKRVIHPGRDLSGRLCRVLNRLCLLG